MREIRYKFTEIIAVHGGLECQAEKADNSFQIHRLLSTSGTGQLLNSDDYQLHFLLLPLCVAQILWPGQQLTDAPMMVISCEQGRVCEIPKKQGHFSRVLNVNLIWEKGFGVHRHIKGGCRQRPSRRSSFDHNNWGPPLLFTLLPVVAWPVCDRSHNRLIPSHHHCPFFSGGPLFIARTPVDYGQGQNSIVYKTTESSAQIWIWPQLNNAGRDFVISTQGPAQ